MAIANFNYENELWNKGHKYVAGCDEVGRGCFAGPVVAGCIVFPTEMEITRSQAKDIIIDDSKKLTSLERERADVWIRKHALAWGVGAVSTKIINSKGLGKALNIAFRKAVSEVSKKVNIDFLLTDAFYIPRIKKLNKKMQLPIIKGDQKSFSIAAASIVAKVYRDNLMRNLGIKKEYKNYFWHKNKGYGTKIHQEAILKYGTTIYHRKMFVETFFRKRKSEHGDQISSYVFSQVR